MPGVIYTFTADAGTDRLTITAHGKVTGDGPAMVFNCGGALPGATPALSSEGDYWLIRVDANTLKLATSSSNAMAGTAIELTSNGFGRNRLALGLPHRRPRIAVPFSQVHPEDFNDEWACIVGGKRGMFRRNIPLHESFKDATNTWAPNGSGLRSTAIAGFTTGASYTAAPFEVGDTIEGLEVWAKSDGTATTKGATMTLAAIAPGGSVAIVATQAITVASGATTRAVFPIAPSSGAGHVMVAAEDLQMSYLATGATGFIIEAAYAICTRT